MKNHALISVNIAVLLFGLAGLFAKWIHLPAICITFGRVFFSSVSLALYMLIRRQPFRVSRKDAALLVFAGVILALHWWAFLESIQLSTVAVGTITFSAFPLFVTFLEPLIFHQKPEKRSIVTAAVILIGVLVTVPEFSLENQTLPGILVGLISALSYAVLTIINKILSGRIHSTVTAFYEQSAAAAVLLPFILTTKVQPAASDFALLLFLGVITTALAHTLFITGLKDLPASLAGICSSLETVYSILFAYLLLGEVPTVRQIIGAVIITAAVITAGR